MKFPDQHHINHVRDALWKRTEHGASVMVGAGFSFNAVPNSATSKSFPAWVEVTEELCRRLYPSDSDYKDARYRFAGTSGFLSLAQEYEASFGKTELHRMIRNMVPDNEYIPGELHRQLLSLPWRDVFTTNWDTLLERTRSDIKYNLVQTPEEIPIANRPRIIKLHGSFPEHTPFIFTEEDFRTYPRAYAPFVNTVQQAMMESIVLLIGFSGDDPNFLQWSGWVRDNLGKYSPKIYLAGYLNLSPNRRRMLEDRSVIPIDLAMHPQASRWPVKMCHSYATEWILESLARGASYDISKWPEHRQGEFSEVREELLPMDMVSSHVPKREPKLPPIENSRHHCIAEVRELIKVWKFNRGLYPNWVFIPPEKYQAIYWDINDWEFIILNSIEGVKTQEKMEILRELVWIREKMLEPLSNELCHTLVELLSSIDCVNNKISGASGNLDWSSIREIWCELCASLLSSLRLSFDEKDFKYWLDKFHVFAGDSLAIRNHYHHEKALYELYTLDFEELNKSLDEWVIEGNRPIFYLKKISILREIGRVADADLLLEECKELMVKEYSDISDCDFSYASVDGWFLCHRMTEFYDSRHKEDHKSKTIISDNVIRHRWRELSKYLCNADDQIKRIIERLKDKKGKEDEALFDFDYKFKPDRVVYSTAYDYEEVRPFRALRLIESAGLPMAFSSNILRLVAQSFRYAHHIFALYTILRTPYSIDDRRIFELLWSRTSMAKLKGEDVALLDLRLKGFLGAVIPRVCNGTNGFSWETRIKKILSAYSRLSIRLPDAQVRELFNYGLGLYGTFELAGNIGLASSIREFYTRCWDSLSREGKLNSILSVLCTPMPGVGIYNSIDPRIGDPGKLLSNISNLPKVDRNSDSVKWAHAISTVEEGLTKASRTKECAAIRFLVFLKLGVLSTKEEKRFCQLLWGEGDSLPDDPVLFDWAYLKINWRENNETVEKAFRRKWFDEPNLNEMGYVDYFEQIGFYLEYYKDNDFLLKLRELDKATIADVVESWLELPLNFNDNMLKKGQLEKQVYHLRYILPNVTLEKSVAKKLLSRIDTFIEQGIQSAYSLYVGLLNSVLYERQALSAIKKGIPADSDRLANAALNALFDWLKFSTDETNNIDSPPIKMLHEVGIIISSRRRSVLNVALQMAEWVYKYGNIKQQEVLYPYILDGLDILITELDYQQSETYFQENDELIPLFRLDCARLAFAMSEKENIDDTVVKQWLDEAKNDPLSEVRNVFDTP